MNYQWNIKEPGDKNKVEQLSKTLNIPNNIANLLVQRGITNYEQAKSFFRPSLDELHDPFLMKDMEKAVERLKQAKENNENILLYGDYDVDGTTSVSLMYTFLKDLFSNLDYYIPNRYTEGYGISYQGIEYAKTNNISLIISLDCGIRAIDKIEKANSYGIDFIICDHHNPGEKIPAAIAVLDPKRKDCNYPYKELSGCGVGFKLLQAFSKDLGLPKKKLFETLDLLALSIAADIVPVTGENRTLAYHGLQLINSNPRKGMKILFENANKKGKITITDLVFIIAPRINAAGRIDSAKKAVELLLSEDSKSGISSGKTIEIQNDTRKGLDREITQAALEIIENNPELKEKKTTVLHSENWHKGVIGIVASRLIETYYRPSIIFTSKDGVATGSARSVKGFDICDAISACGDLLVQFGGHKYAAGLSVKLENLDAFTQKFETIVSNTIDPNLLIPKITIDSAIDLDHITPKFYRLLQQFEPFGPGNMKPAFVSDNLCKGGPLRIVGTNHLKLSVEQQGLPNISFDAIGFNLGSHYEKIVAEKNFKMAFNLETNYWNGQTTLQLNAKDLKYN